MVLFESPPPPSCSFALALHACFCLVSSPLLPSVHMHSYDAPLASAKPASSSSPPPDGHAPAAALPPVGFSATAEDTAGTARMAANGAAVEGGKRGKRPGSA